MSRLVLFAIFLPLLLIGCLQPNTESTEPALTVDSTAEEPSDGYSLPDEDFENASDRDISISQPHLMGDMGLEMQNLDEDATLSGYYNTSSSQLELIVVNGQGSAMVLFTVAGDLMEAVEAEESLSFDPLYRTQSELFITGIACSGDNDPYNWSYDKGLDLVETQAEPMGDYTRLHFVVYHSDSVAAGHLDVRVGD